MAERFQAKFTSGLVGAVGCFLEFFVSLLLRDVAGDVDEDVGRFVGEDAKVSVFAELLQYRVRCC